MNTVLHVMPTLKVPTQGGDEDEDRETDFADISLGKRSVRNKLDEFLAQPVEDVKDALGWWYKHRQVYPSLSRMARDYLSIPGEWPSRCVCAAVSNIVIQQRRPLLNGVFLRGRHLLHFTRSRLTASGLQAHLCLGSWGLHDLYRAENILGVVGLKKRKLVSDEEKEAEAEAGPSGSV
jgi:hypothetical protein